MYCDICSIVKILYSYTPTTVHLYDKYEATEEWMDSQENICSPVLFCSSHIQKLCLTRVILGYQLALI